MELVKLGGNLESPRNSKPSDYPAVGPTGSEGSASGAGQLVKQTSEQIAPRSVQDDGDNKPSNWGKDTWKVGKSSAGAGTTVKVGCSVDFETGKHCC